MGMPKFEQPRSADRIVQTRSILFCLTVSRYLQLGIPGFEPGQRGPKPRIITKLDHIPDTRQKQIMGF